jgi:hypothetical protein
MRTIDARSVPSSERLSTSPAASQFRPSVLRQLAPGRSGKVDAQHSLDDEQSHERSTQGVHHGSAVSRQPLPPSLMDGGRPDRHPARSTELWWVGPQNRPATTAPVAVSTKVVVLVHPHTTRQGPSKETADVRSTHHHNRLPARHPAPRSGRHLLGQRTKAPGPKIRMPASTTAALADATGHRRPNFICASRTPGVRCRTQQQRP